MSGSGGDDRGPEEPIGGIDVVAEQGDRQLLGGVARESHDALAEAYSRHGPSVRAVARRLVGPELADDMVHDVFLRLWNHPEQFNASHGSLRWLLIAQIHSRAIDLRRGARTRETRTTANIIDHSSGAPVVDEQALANLVGDHAWHLLSRLDDRERRAIALAYLGGHSYREIARMLDQPEATVLTSIRRGLIRLRAESSAVASDATTASKPPTASELRHTGAC